MKKWIAVFWTIGLVSGADLTPRSTGLRFGASATSIDDLYTQIETVLRWELHRPLDFGGSWWGRADVDFSLGPLTGRVNTGLIASLGPLFEAGRKGCPVSLVLGISPTFLGLRHYDQDDFGSHLQLTSHAGFNIALGHGWSLGYRFQHMSNAHLGDSNPGLNLHVLTVMLRL
jgi:hypothetical protein